MTADEYTPTTGQVRRYWQYGANAWADEVARDDDTQGDGSSIGAEFDRFLAAHDAEVARAAKAEAWEQGARHVYDEGGKCSFARDGDPCPYNPYRKVVTDE